MPKIPAFPGARAMRRYAWRLSSPVRVYHYAHLRISTTDMARASSSIPGLFPLREPSTSFNFSYTSERGQIPANAIDFRPDLLPPTFPPGSHSALSTGNISDAFTTWPLPYGYDSALPNDVPDTFTACTYPVRTELCPTLEPAHLFQGFIIGDTPLSPVTPSIDVRPATYTNPAQPHHDVVMLRRQLCDLVGRLLPLIQSLDVPPNNPLPQNLETSTDFDRDYQLPGLDSIATLFPTHEPQPLASSRIQLPDMAAIISTPHNLATDPNLDHQVPTVDTNTNLYTHQNPEAQQLQLSKNPLISSASQPIGCPEYPLASGSQTQTPAMQPPLGPESISTPETSSGREEKRHRCDICGKSFRRPYLLDDHKRKHSGDVAKPYFCHLEGCSQAYTSQSNLTRHVRESHRRAENTHSPLPTSDEQALGEIPEQPPFAGPSTHSARDRTSTRCLGQETPDSSNFRFRDPETQDSIRRKADGRRRNRHSTPSMDVSAEVVDGCEEGGGSPEGESNLASSTGSPAGITPGGQPILNRSTEPGEAAASGTGGVGPVRAVKERRTIRKQAMDFAGLFGAGRYGRM